MFRITTHLHEVHALTYDTYLYTHEGRVDVMVELSRCRRNCGLEVNDGGPFTSKTDCTKAHHRPCSKNIISILQLLTGWSDVISK